ncbi:MAG: cytochrome b N-terminal domain-containing protein [Ideonella sp.]|nr:cytochrome b N-terminal domain-containing protein [Ideonella sp.]MCC7458822.1 cytochrome b N-terminal domain-containing protein [Nitrospira sp.]
MTAATPRAALPSSLPRTAHAVRAAERALDALFGPAANPLRQLGALAFWMLWWVVVSGFWIYALYDTSVRGAYESVQAISAQRFGAGLMRSVHRYAADALVVLAVLHLLREALLGRFRHFRWFSWVSGVPLLPLAVASGMVGYWMVWDARAQVVGVALFEWFAQIPGFGLALVRNFIDPQAITDRFFSLLSFTHVGLPLLLLLGAWAHLLRLARPRTQPSRALALGSSAMLLVLSLLWPARSLPPADLARWPEQIDLDWIMLGVLPLADAAPWLSWLALVLGFALLFALPWWPGAPPARPAAVVDPAHCNGCRLCEADCPYGAITMVPHPNPRATGQLARVHTDQCAGCGVCVGACPSATPFRRGAPFATGIDLPQLPLAALRGRLDAALDALERSPGTRVLVLGCDHAARLDDRAAAAAVMLTAPCAAKPDDGAAPATVMLAAPCAAEPHDRAAPATVMLTAPCAALWPPVFVEYALRRGADGVLLGGCPPGDCPWRLGSRWVEQRLAGQRLPQLRTQVPRERVRLHQALTEDKTALVEAVQAFHRALAGRPRLPGDTAPRND